MKLKEVAKPETVETSDYWFKFSFEGKPTVIYLTIKHGKTTKKLRLSSHQQVAAYRTFMLLNQLYKKKRTLEEAMTILNLKEVTE